MPQLGHSATEERSARSLHRSLGFPQPAMAQLAGEFQVNTYTTSYQYFPAVAADADGDFVVVWESYRQDGSGFGVFGQRYTSAGAAVGAEFQVNTFTTSYQRHRPWRPTPMATSWWCGSSTQDGSGSGVFGQRYTSAGAAMGAEFQVNTYTTSSPALPGRGGRSPMATSWWSGSSDARTGVRLASLASATRAPGPRSAPSSR